MRQAQKTIAADKMPSTLSDALSKQGISWEAGKQHPKWVELEECSLDQFYTDANTAKACYGKLLAFLGERGIVEQDCLFVEPSAGRGAFSSLLQAGSICLDLEPQEKMAERRDFLTWDAGFDARILAAKEAGKHIVAIGNPPFGNRGWMALAFMSRCAAFCDFCAFLLPMSFASEGKGSPKYRVEGMRLARSEEMLGEVFSLPDGTRRKLNVVWQIWEKGENVREDFSDIDELFEIHFCCDLDYRRCGQAFKEEADAFVPQALFPKTPIALTDDWGEVFYDGAYGVKALDATMKGEMLRALEEADWERHSTFSTHGCRHIGMTEIKRALADAFRTKDA